MRNAVRRAEFLLATGNNLEGKLSKILNAMSQAMETDGAGLNDEAGDAAPRITLFPQSCISTESLKTIPVKKKMTQIGNIDMTPVLSEEERALYKEALKQKNRRRFTRKNINAYVSELLKDREKVPVTEIEVQNRRDVIRLIYVSIYAGNPANLYKVRRSRRRTEVAGCRIPYFEIMRR